MDRQDIKEIFKPVDPALFRFTDRVCPVCGVKHWELTSKCATCRDMA